MELLLTTTHAHSHDTYLYFPHRAGFGTLNQVARGS